ncbi:glycosyltransferase family 2 protein [Pseudooceanicola nanhaiensis]|uniref:glycosyltransferase family 2 protein n=1 Tax=Pseudooceanicola nanhaiensis TaxID=375761 RepID=UPI001CD5A325|nr:glycosyltransferase family 2 protein [Pseudooceanicola nanhaiensis]MCA0921032.1 glycosyltransferase family 2 protein [Pseudooceanicola nanhaiensis]
MSDAWSIALSRHAGRAEPLPAATPGDGAETEAGSLRSAGPKREVTWGLVSTIKAPAHKVLDFAAWHLEMGAHRLFLYLDDPEDPVFEVLKAHPRIRPTLCDRRHWKRLGRRPEKHQPRQTMNATQAYAKADVDWLAHIDVDEFLIAPRPMAEVLSALPDTCHAARVRPVEALAPGADTPPGTTRFKACALDRGTRLAQSAEVYPEFGQWLNGGFLSHVAGKIFARPGLLGAEFRIHNLKTAEGDNPGQQELSEVELAHFHAPHLEAWLAAYRFRLEQGSYRAELKPARARDKGGLSMHELFTLIEAEEGETGLRRFFAEVGQDSPDLRGKLAAHGLLRELSLPLDSLREKHFPGAVPDHDAAGPA